MGIQRSYFYTKQDMMSPLGMPFEIKKKVMVQYNTHIMGETIQTLVVKVDQQRCKEFIFLGLASPKVTWHYHRVNIRVSITMEEETSI